jgi:predicted transport protein
MEYTYQYGFYAKLYNSEKLMQEAFTRIRDEIISRKDVKLRESFKKIRVYYKRQTLAVLLFKGKKLSVCMNLNPNDYVNTKYRGKDMSSKKSYKDTPFMMKVTSLRKIKYICELLNELLEEFSYNETHEEIRFPFYTLEKLIELGLVKKKIKKEILIEGETLEEVDAEEGEDEDDSAWLLDEKLEKSSRKYSSIVNLEYLNDFYLDGEIVSMRSLKNYDIIKQNARSCKVLGHFNLTKKLTFKGLKFSREALNCVKSSNSDIIG